MMGGPGSGRRPSFESDTVESYRTIDVNLLNRGGWLRPGRQGVLTWTRDGVEVARITLTARYRHLRLSYCVRTSAGGWQDLDQHIAIEHVACHLGGSRPFFICPGTQTGTICGRRVVKLYGAGRYYLCRHCYQLAYACQREQLWDRKARRAGKIRARLGGSPGIYTPFPEKPRGMWWRTYERLYAQAHEAALAAEEAILDR